MIDVFRIDGPEPFETELFVKFGYDVRVAAQAVIQYSRLIRDDVPHDEALAKIEALHELPDGQLAIWLSADRSPTPPSN